MAAAESPDFIKNDHEDNDLPCFSSIECPRHLFCMDGFCNLWPNDISIDKSLPTEKINDGFPRSFISFFALFFTLILLFVFCYSCIKCITNSFTVRNLTPVSTPSSRSFRGGRNEITLSQLSSSSSIYPSQGVFPVPMYQRNLINYSNTTDGVTAKYDVVADEDDDPPPSYSQVIKQNNETK